MDFENFRKLFRFSTSGDLSNQTQNLSVSYICLVSHRLRQYLFPCCTIKTDRVMAISKFDLLFDLMPTSMTWHIIAQLHIPNYIPAKYSVCVAPVLHSYSVRTNIVTNKHTGWKHHYLAVAGDSNSVLSYEWQWSVSLPVSKRSAIVNYVIFIRSTKVNTWTQLISSKYI